MLKRTSSRILLVVALFLFTFVICEAKEVTFDHDGTYDIDKNGTFILDSEDAEVSIKGTDRKDVHIVVHYERNISGRFRKSGNDEFEVEITEENGNVRYREIDYDVTYFGSIIINQERYTIDIEIPKTVSLKIRGEDDDYLIENVDGDISMIVEDGDARLRNVNGTSYEFDIEDGNIEMLGGGGVLDISSEDGDVLIENGKFTEIMGRTEDGEIEIETTLSDNGSYRMRADDGDIEFTVLGGGGEFTVEYDDGRARASRQFEEIEDDDGYKVYTLPGGNARVRIRVSDGSAILKTR